MPGDPFAFAPGAPGYPNPFADVASVSTPRNFRNALEWAEWVFGRFAPYRTAMERVIAYFATDIEFVDVSDDEREKLETFNKRVALMSAIQDLNRDMFCYGNGFASLVLPFVRYLTCPKCGSSFRLSVVHDNAVFGFRFELPDFHAACPTCKVGSGYRGKWLIDDREGNLEEEIRVKRWSPHDIEILHDPWTHECHYLWRIPQDYADLIKQGHLFHLERCPRNVLQAIAQKRLYRFRPGALYHMREATLAGYRLRGWGVPRLLRDSGNVYRLQVLLRKDEAIALEYVVPLRVITPAPRPGSGAGGGISVDPLMMHNGGDLRRQLERMIREHRRDPGGIQFLGFPVEFQMLGAAKDLSPVDQIVQAYEMLMNDAGVPIELYRSSLQLQTAPTALRLFESMWRPLVSANDEFATWFYDQTSDALGWERTQARLRRTTMADNLEEKLLGVQLWLSDRLSGETALTPLGHDFKREVRQIAEEGRYQLEQRARQEEEMQEAGEMQQLLRGGGQMAPPGAAPAGGAPAQGAAPPQGAPMGGAGGPVTMWLQSGQQNMPPDQMLATAQMLAQDLFGQPESVKDSELRLLAKSNQLMHDLVTGNLERMRSKIRDQGGNQAVGMAQMQAQGVPVG